MKTKECRNRYKKRRGSRGSITVFLAAILAAMLTFSFAVMDLARINLALATSRSNAALVGNAVLADYNDVLKEAYGLLANSHNMDELSENVARYYVSTMEATGADVKSLNESYEFIRTLINNSDFPEKNNNYLRSLPVSKTVEDYTNEKGVVVEPILASAISNPDVMKREIVEYMKFRAPVNLATGFLEKINVFQDLGNQAKATEDRIEYEDSLNKVQNGSDEAYTYMMAYLHNIEETSGRTNFSAESTIQYHQQKMSSFYTNIMLPEETHPSGWIQYYGQEPDEVMRQAYNDLIEAIERIEPVKSIINADAKLKSKRTIKLTGLDSVSNLVNLVDSLKNGNNEKKESYKYLEEKYKANRKQPASIYGNYNYVTSSSGHIGTIAQNMSNIAVSARDYDSKTYNLFLDSTGIYNEGRYDWTTESEIKGGLAHSYYSFFKLYYYYKYHIDEFDENEQKLFEENSTDIDEVKDVFVWMYGEPEIRDFDNTWLQSATTDCAFQATLTNLKNVAQSALEKYNDVLKDYGSFLCYQKRMAEDMAGLNDEIESPLAVLKRRIDETIKKGEQWDESISNVQTEAYQASMKNTHDVENKNFEDIDVSGMIEDMKTQAAEWEQAYENFTNTYGYLNDKATIKEKMFTDYDDGGAFGNGSIDKSFKCLHLQIYDLLEKWSEPGVMTDFATTLNYEKIGEPSTVNPKPTIRTNWAEFSMTLKSPANNNDKIIALIKQISEKNIIEDVGTRDSLKSDGENAKNEADDRSKKQSEDLENSKNSLGVGEDEKKKTEEAKKDPNSDMLKNMREVVGTETFSEYAKRVDLDAQSTGDSSDPYTINYSKPNTNKDDEGNYDLSGMTSILKSVQEMFSNIARGGRDNLYVTEYLTSAFTCMTTNIKDGKETEGEEKSITGYAFSKDANKIYRSELEYIIYGQDTEFGNKAAAIASISAIRLVLNLIYSFTDSEITLFTTSTATALTALFPFAMPVVKVVLHILISSAETAWDMMELCKGNSVPIYKSPQTWVCKCTNIIGNVAKETAKTVISELEDQASAFIEDKIDEKSKEFDDWIDSVAREKEDELVAQLNTYIISPVNEFVTNAIAMAKDDDYNISEELNKLINDRIFSKLDELKNSDSILGEAVAALVGDSSFKSELKSKVLGFINTQVTNMRDKHIVDNLETFHSKFKDTMKGIEDKIVGVVKSLHTKIKGFVDDSAKKLKQEAVKGINKAGDKVMSSLNAKLSEKLTGTRNVNINMGSGSDTGVSGGGSALNNLLAMSYKDYMYLFLFIGLIDGGRDELERAGQIMEVNVKMKSSGFTMNNAYTMFNIHSSSKIKTYIAGRFADDHGMTLKNVSDGYYNIDLSEFTAY
ncbi:DUF5702 domain-containing protein [Ruminococcus sp.]|uniref:DUF5702 domain-containing protein n=1 Tax=Ruminococcus sp. TaxID=41978 RepID=UPI0025D65AD0|nr:DUF5702 domain-containing protein [Ruminococcus sp.]MBR1432585.1 hypothetical protein [Ruminococcus sp.]